VQAQVPRLVGQLVQERVQVPRRVPGASPPVVAVTVERLAGVEVAATAQEPE
tara:strand:+ start:369 stop:524 length:156 start_codon:yes stop_codon:yes gene_type:complete